MVNRLHAECHLVLGIENPQCQIMFESFVVYVEKSDSTLLIALAPLCVVGWRHTIFQKQSQLENSLAIIVMGCFKLSYGNV